MVLPRKFRDIVLCLALLAVPILFLQSNLKSPGELNPLDRLLLRVSAPVQAGVTGAVSGIHRGWRRYVYLIDVQRDNEHLRRENTELRARLEEARRNLGRMEHLEKLLRFRAQRGVETAGIRVIGRDASPFVRVLRVKVDRGKDTLRPGLPVVTAEGAVGRVGRVYGPYSDIVLAVDPKSAVDVVIQRTGGRGVLRGIDGANRYTCRIDYLLRQEEVKVGDLVVTSGVAGVFPKDLPVGRISKVSRRTHGLYQEVEVTPTVDFSSLREMLVILAPPPPTTTPGPKRSVPARGILP
jgi:rod shape-determining protein MreC